MQHLYIDESGSMTTEHLQGFPYFTIAIIKAVNKNKLKFAYKKFIRQNLAELKEMDTQGKMFRGDDFIELKGSCFTPEFKKKFIHFFCRNDYLEVFYIKMDNSRLSSHFYKNTSRAFNYTLKLAMGYYLRHGLLPKDEYIIQIDERNIKTKAKFTLEDYLNTELVLSELLCDDIQIVYFNSENNMFIQIADVFSNIFFSNLFKNEYAKEIDMMMKTGYLKNIFIFPAENIDKMSNIC